MLWKSATSAAAGEHRKWLYAWWVILVVVDGKGGREYSWHTFSREVKEEQTTTAMGNWNQITGVITFNIPPVIPWNMLRRLIARPAYRERLSLVLHTTHSLPPTWKWHLPWVWLAGHIKIYLQCSSLCSSWRTNAMVNEGGWCCLWSFIENFLIKRNHCVFANLIEMEWNGMTNVKWFQFIIQGKEKEETRSEQRVEQVIMDSCRKRITIIITSEYIGIYSVYLLW